jgi:ABC-type multidrug transport system fused ATPase/permease subunit
LWTRSYEAESELYYTLQRLYIQHIQQPMNLRENTTSFSTQKTSSPNDDLWFYLGVYVLLSFILIVLGVVKYLMAYLASLRASRRMFEKMCYTVLRAPLRWLDTVPVGRILNRFTADFNTLDSKIALHLSFCGYMMLEVAGITIAVLFVSPIMILFAVVFLALALWVARRYLGGAREIKRLESNAKSPIFEQFGSALAGVGTIRAFDKAEEYIQRYPTVLFGFPSGDADPVRRMFNKIDTHGRAYYHNWLFNRWMGFRHNIIGALFTLVVAVIVVSLENIDAALAGFALTFALEYTASIIWSVRSYASTEMDMNATERILEYSYIATEDQGGSAPPAAWPTEGRLEVDGIVVGYAPDLPPVLKGLSFTVEKHQRVGVVGRTGAGKSSLTLALFRFLEAREGTILVDGVDISKINLHDLRSRLAIIPQDPVLFSGTIRSNLDPFSEHTDAELRDALERVHLVGGTRSGSRGSPEPNVAGEGSASAGGTGATTPDPDRNANIFASLSSKISEGGLNLSQGQRQLLCLARAIVSRPKIMVLDEATSAVDMATDVLIQRSIREEFGESTLLVIAHRLSTIADFDRILVMSDGRGVEFGTPRELLRRRGTFWEMVGQSGEKERLVEIIEERKGKY